jgi:hypothetical protein
MVPPPGVLRQCTFQYKSGDVFEGKEYMGEILPFAFGAIKLQTPISYHKLIIVVFTIS